MTRAKPRPAAAPDARSKLLDCAMRMIRERGFADMSVADLCAAAGVTKGAFFHHFESKEALGVAAARHWAETTGAIFGEAPYHAPAEPVDRVLAYIAFRREILAGEMADFTCVAGTLAQETHLTHPAIARAAGAAITGHAQTLEADIAAAFAARGIDPPPVSPQSLALHTQVVLQGAFVLAKATGSIEVAHDSVDHLARYVRCLFNLPRE